MNNQHSVHTITFEYRNYRGEHSVRTVHPIHVWYGLSERHEEAQFFLKAYDPTKGAERDFAINDMVGDRRWYALAHLIEQENSLNLRDMLPVGHVILEQAENFESGTVTQTVQRQNGTGYERIVDSEEAYSYHNREHTMVLDASGKMICVGDIVQMYVEEPFKSFGLHGDWVQYEVRKCPGGYMLSYSVSQKGQVLPQGYTSGLLTDFILKPGNEDLKRLLSATVPIKSTLLNIVFPHRAPF
jgi:hypothetical protein